MGEPGPARARSTPRSAASRWSAPRGSPGSRFGYIAGDSALVAMALYRFALDRAAAHGHTPLIPPVLVREQAMYGTGFFPTERSNIYALEDDELYLTGTSEVALAGFHMEEILEELPLRYSAFSTCFRREAGAAGKDTSGMFRVHQFNKVELFVYCEPERSGEEHDRLLAIEEELVQALGLPYRVVNVAAGDLGDPAAKKYDIEAWFPHQQRYREITSTSNTTDFQARRLGIRYRVGEKRLETPHTLNGTAVTDRWLLAILENFGGEVPDALQALRRRRASRRKVCCNTGRWQPALAGQSSLALVVRRCRVGGDPAPGRRHEALRAGPRRAEAAEEATLAPYVPRSTRSSSPLARSSRAI